MTQASAYVARETAISAVINAAISVAFFLVVFGFGTVIPVWGIGNYAFDFMPQSFAVAFFASFVPTLLTRKAILAGRVSAASHSVPTLRSLFFTSLAFGFAGMTIGAGLWATALWASYASSIAANFAITIKVAYGAALGALVTRYRLRAMLL